MLLVLVTACVACAEDGPPALPILDIETVVSTEAVWSEARFESEPLLEVGSVEGGGAEMFQSVATVRFSDTGKIIVADNGAERVLVFSADGDHVVTHGTTGQGPGEFRDLARALPFRGDSLVAFDFGNNRSLVFPTHEGESRAVSANFRSARAPVLGALSMGELLAYQGSARRSERVEGQWDSTIVVVFPPSEEPRESESRAPTLYSVPRVEFWPAAGTGSEGSASSGAIRLLLGPHRSIFDRSVRRFGGARPPVGAPRGAGGNTCGGRIGLPDGVDRVRSPAWSTDRGRMGAAPQ